MGFAQSAMAVNSKGGTEMMVDGLRNALTEDMLDEFQIFVSRVEEPLDPSKIRILWLHDLPNDPASAHLANGGWKRFHRLVFASNWQMQAYIATFQIPWDRCIVIQNAITPIPAHEKPPCGPNDTIRLAYWSTPHRGLNILIPVFKKLREKFPNIELDVYSSFNLYGWGDRDSEFEHLFEECRNSEGINYHGAIPNEELRKRLEQTHILAYPSIWPETSCLVLMEAMSAGLICVHSNLAALPETAANWTNMYQFSEDLNAHANMFFANLEFVVANINAEGIKGRVKSQAVYANAFYGWEIRAHQWNIFLTGLLQQDPDRAIEEPEQPGQYFNYRT